MREQIARIESGTEDIAEAAAEARAKARIQEPEKIAQQEWSGANYPGMPDNDDWLENIPPEYVDGERGFELRLARDLAAVGVRCFRLADLDNYVGTDPQAVPVFIDWLADLDRKIPGPETTHRQGIRAHLLHNLADPVAYGDQAAIAALIAQLRRDPPMPTDLQWWAGGALDKIAGPENYAEILGLFNELTDDNPRAALLPYLGRSKTPEAIQIAVDALADRGTRQWAIQALILAEADGTLPLIARYADDESEQVRDWVHTAMEQLE
ncbi:HEAT repeat domain-containing protein [Nocardia sp. NPDC060259]|uniref:HEAT repeat domain-containing protein n=1 Tax=Nocardia sp. NPDC060259 TaxID=3347088 RepID=UPI00365A85AD